MWKCHHSKTPPTHTHTHTEIGIGGRGEGTASQKAIKICDHLFPLARLIHLSGEWFCPYPPKATNLFSCLSPCIRMNLWNSQTCSLFSFTPFLVFRLSPLPTPFSDLFRFYLYPCPLPPSVSDCPCVFLFPPILSLPCPFPSSLSFPISLCQKRPNESNSNHIQKIGSNNKTLSMAI